jgi:hypothetical protein
MRAYMLFDCASCPGEGAVLVFAHSARDAKRLGWRTIKEWTGSEYLVVARPLPGKEVWLAAQEGVDLEGEPRMIGSPQCCDRCDLWGTAPLSQLGGEVVCETCADEDDDAYLEE